MLYIFPYDFIEIYIKLVEFYIKHKELHKILYKSYRVPYKYITNHRIEHIVCRNLWNCLEFTLCDWILWNCTGRSIQLETPKIINQRPSGNSQNFSMENYFHTDLHASVWHCHERSERWKEGDGEGVGMWCRAQILS